MFEDYEEPGLRAPFQNGEYAVVTKKLSYYSPQPKRSYKFQGMTGKVIGYKTVPGSYSKYLLEFDNGEKEAFMATILAGPFDNRETAKKYEGIVNAKPELKDLAIRVQKKARTDYQTQPANEKLLKEYLTAAPFNFEWYEQPLIDQELAKKYESDFTESVYFILGQSKVNPEHRLVRKNVKKSKRLQEYILIGPSYTLMHSHLEGCKYTSYKDENANSYEHTGFTIKYLIESLRGKPKPGYTGGYMDAESYRGVYITFDKYKNAKTVTNEFIQDFMKYNGVVSGDHYTTETNFDVDLSRLDDPSFLKPFTFTFKTGMFRVEGLSKQKNLEGCPKKIIGDFSVTGGALTKPERVKGAPEVTGDVNLGLGYSNVAHLKDKIEKAFEEEGKYKELRKELPELDGIF